MEMAQAIVTAAEEEQAPVIIQASQGAIKYAGLEMITAMADVLANHASVPVVLHLDHGTDYKQNVKCLRAGFTSLMFDGHELPLEDNIATTKKIVDIAHAVGLPVEAEIGSVLTIEGLLSDNEIAEIRAMPIPQQFEILRKKIGPTVDDHIAKPEEAKRFVDETGVDFLAAAVGSVHGLWLDIWPLRVDRLKEIYEATNVPIVSHGSSGVLIRREDAEAKGVELAAGEGSLLDAIKVGYTKINVATALSMEFNRGMLEAVKGGMLNDEPELIACKCEAIDATNKLIKRAQKAGVLRKDLNADDIYALSAGVAESAHAAVREGVADPKDAHKRYMSIMLAGLRPVVA
jgi:fructose-bisphosphate aldolase class II